MRSGLNFPFDVLKEVGRLFVVRIALLIPCIPLGLAVGAFFRFGSEFTFEHAFRFLPILPFAWMFSFSYLFADLVTLAVLVAVLRTESNPLLLYVFLVLAWACAGFAGF